MEQIHIKYLNSFGSERFKNYCRWLLEYCFDNLKLVPWIEEFEDLIQFLRKYNLWYTLYL